jgi:hypothetical protein
MLRICSYTFVYMERQRISSTIRPKLKKAILKAAKEQEITPSKWVEKALEAQAIAVGLKE